MMGHPGAAAVLHRTDFPAFPHEPYSIQRDLMRSLYEALSKGGVGFFESPTGTGKTLCLISACLHWLEDSRAASATAPKAEEGAAVAGGPHMPDWMRGHAERLERDRQAHLLRAQMERLEVLRSARRQRGARPAAGAKTGPGGAPNDDDEFILEEVEEGAASEPGASRKRPVLSDSESEEEGLGGPALQAETPEVPSKTQIIFCSRTHSQLSQFVGELRRTRFVDSLSLVVLGSRGALCINDAVARLGSPAAVNEACAELQRRPAPRKKAGSGERTGGKGACPYLARGGAHAASLRDMVLAHPIDIEELAKLGELGIVSGQRRAVCPYYAARDALPEADIILAPYSALLLRETRDALGLQLKGNVFVVDEAHNLVDAVNDAHSATVTGRQAAACTAQMERYLAQYRSRLGMQACLALQQLLLVSRAVGRACAARPQGSQTGEAHARSLNAFVLEHGLEGVNIFQLLRYASETRLVQRVAGYWRSCEMENSGPGSNSVPGMEAGKPGGGGGGLGIEAAGQGPLHALLSLLRGLRSADKDGRIIVDPGGADGGSLRFVLVDAGRLFSSIVSEARSVILASGTLSPLGPLLTLFPGVPMDRLHRFSCGHVVGKERLLALALASGSSGTPLDFRFSRRGDPAVLRELGQVLLNVCRVTPGGTIAFFPSHHYMEEAVASWKASGQWTRLEACVPVLLEPRTAAEVDATLVAHAAACAPPPTFGALPSGPPPRRLGCLLLAVVGGRLAEGINFGDALGRAVVMVGLPYPNPADPELRERLRAMDAAAAAASTSLGIQGPALQPPPSRGHYQDLCMKGVNQCIGRAIRHSRDYAAVLLLDPRYAESFTKPLRPPLAKLPAWILPSLEVPQGGFGPAYTRLVRFFKAMQQTEG
ncbi:XPD4 [Auxenochlorella protothecoides x Auxenochlorella symbiontica]